jgi:hydrogenase maturation protease
MDGYDLAILVDALPRGEPSGTLYLFEPDTETLELPAQAALDAHGMDPVKVLHLVKMLGGETKRVLIVGCEPESFGDDAGAMGLSEPVAAVLEEAMRMVQAQFVSCPERERKE